MEIIIVLEVLLMLFAVWGIFNEERFIAFENRHFPKLKKWRAEK